MGDNKYRKRKACKISSKLRIHYFRIKNKIPGKTEIGEHLISKENMYKQFDIYN